MFNLPTESQLDIFKFLDFDQIFQFQQINNTFLKIINEYKKEFSRKEFETISMWQTAINKQIPLYANEPNNEYYIQLLKKENVTPRRLILNLPNIPKNIEEMLIIRFWLEELSFCIFENFEFQVLFNPELIKLLFEENPINFHSQKVFIKFKNKNVKKVLNSAMDNLMVYKYVIINFGEIWNNEDYNEEHIETSTNFSNMIPKITFNEICWDRSKLSERAENIKSAIKDGKLIFEKYQLSNINNPKIKFSINKKIRDDGRIIKIEIKKIRG
uniref:F-box domain-containing protein n=1 Tax=Meloidogyne hapla TaxID=6305 RepID=A0A1I8BEG3_MELHA